MRAKVRTPLGEVILASSDVYLCLAATRIIFGDYLGGAALLDMPSCFRGSDRRKDMVPAVLSHTGEGELMTVEIGSIVLSA